MLSPRHFPNLLPPPDAQGVWVLSDESSTYESGERLALRLLWAVSSQEATNARPGAPRNFVRGQNPHYLFQVVDRPTADSIEGALYSHVSPSASGAAPLWAKGVPWHPVQGEDWCGFMKSLGDGERSFFTFDGVSLWQCLGYSQKVGSHRLLVELRRQSAVGFITTESLLFQYPLAFMFDDGLRREVEDRIRNIEDWIRQERWDAVIQSTADTCDRLLLDALLRAETAGRRLDSQGRHKDVRRWHLSHRIEEAIRLGLLKEASPLHFQLQVSRSLGNLHHGGAAQVRPMALHPVDAMGCYAALKNLLDRLSRLRREEHRG